MGSDHGHDHDHGSDHGHGHGHGDWFRHESAEGMPQSEHAAHVSPGALGVAFVAILFGVVAMILILWLWFAGYVNERTVVLQEGIQPAEQALQYRGDAEARLRTAGWVDRANGVVRIPVERAMDLVVEEYRGRPLTAAGE